MTITKIMMLTMMLVIFVKVLLLNFRYVITSCVGVKMAQTARITAKKQTLEDAYSPPANFLEIDVTDPQTHGVAKKRYTDYEVRIRVNI